jgi:phage terminase small subunit
MLDDEGRKCWFWMAAALKPLGLLSIDYAPAMTATCQAWSLYLRTAAAINALIFTASPRDEDANQEPPKTKATKGRKKSGRVSLVDTAPQVPSPKTQDHGSQSSGTQPQASLTPALGTAAMAETIVSLHKIYDTAYKQAMKGFAEFGLTAAARSRIAAPKKEDAPSGKSRLLKLRA